MTDPLSLIQIDLVLLLGNYLLGLMMVGLFLIWRRSRPEALVHAFFSAVLAWAIAEFLKDVFPFPRPFEQNGFFPGRFLTPTSSSFPSSHAASAFAFGFSAFLHDGLVGQVLLIGSFAVGLSRIAGNVHYSIDVVAGAVIGILVSYFAFRLHHHLLPKKHRVDS